MSMLIYIYFHINVIIFIIFANCRNYSAETREKRSDIVLNNRFQIVRFTLSYTKKGTEVPCFVNGATDGARTREMPEPQSGALTNFATIAITMREQF